MAGDYYEVLLPKNKKTRDSGKYVLRKKEREHGHSTTPVTLQSMMGTERMNREGGSDFKRDMREVEANA